MTSTVIYTGELRTRCEHLKSGNEFITDAPTDNNGLGQAFSPTDTVATALASCMLTVMGIKARDHQLDLTDSKAEVTKIMASNPRRIAEIKIVMQLPSGILPNHRKILEKVANTCPVFQSIHPEIITDITYNWVL